MRFPHAFADARAKIKSDFCRHIDEPWALGKPTLSNYHCCRGRVFNILEGRRVRRCEACFGSLSQTPGPIAEWPTLLRRVIDLLVRSKAHARGNV